MNADLFIKSKIGELLNEFPLVTKNASNTIKFEPITNNFLGEANKFPDQESFSQIRIIYAKHSDACKALNHPELHTFFNQFEDSKGNFIYIFWAHYSSILLKSESFKIIENNLFEKAPKFNNRNLNKHRGDDALLVPIYVGKSEGKLNGRIICHVDGTKGEYPALKIRERLNGAQIYLSLIPINFNLGEAEDKNFLSKVMCFSLEYFFATKLKPVIGMHK